MSVMDRAGNERPDHSHDYDHDFWDGPFSLTPHYITSEPCDEIECFGTLDNGRRDIREIVEEPEEEPVASI